MLIFLHDNFPALSVMLCYLVTCQYYRLSCGLCTIFMLCKNTLYRVFQDLVWQVLLSPLGDNGLVVSCLKTQSGVKLNPGFKLLNVSLHQFICKIRVVSIYLKQLWRLSKAKQNTLENVMTSSTEKLISLFNFLNYCAILLPWEWYWFFRLTRALQKQLLRA